MGQRQIGLSWRSSKVALKAKKIWLPSQKIPEISSFAGD